MKRGEFQFIEELLQPLAGEGAFGLQDDIAQLPGSKTVISKDVLVAGTHFFADDAPDLIARKALRVNVSDIIAKGATPIGYFLGLVLPQEFEDKQAEKFVEGLQADQTQYGIKLLGGDTTRHAGDGPLTISVTMIGEVTNQPVLRATASVGDLIMVTGTIGDASLGLQIREGKVLKGLSDKDAATLEKAYLLSEPPFGFHDAIAELATASIDVSDGLLADLGHTAKASALGFDLEMAAVPISSAAQNWLELQKDQHAALLRLISGGDDYQTLFTIKPDMLEAIRQRAAELKIRVSQIGSMKEQTTESLLHMPDGTSIPASSVSGGYDHFSKD
jgi:thiamine-monophosphate kinase